MVDLERRRYEDEFPQLVDSVGACGMPAITTPLLCGIAPSPVDNGHDDLWPVVCSTPYPCEVYSAATPPLHVGAYPATGSTSFDNPAIIATITEEADCGCRGGRPVQRSTCNAARLGGASGSLVGTMLTPDVADDAQTRAATVKPELYMSEMMRTIQEEMRIMRQVIEDDERLDALYTEDEDGELIASLTRVVKCAMDSGACASVIHPDMLPSGVVPSGNPSGQVFHGANNSPIRRFGHAVTRMKNGSMDVGCGWQVAEVTRPLNSVADVCGPMEHEIGHQDVLFNNKSCFVVPPGVVAAIMKHLEAVAEYPREGNLYLAEVELSSFTRPAQDQ